MLSGAGDAILATSRAQRLLRANGLGDFIDAQAVKG